MGGIQNAWDDNTRVYSPVGRGQFAPGCRADLILRIRQKKYNEKKRSSAVWSIREAAQNILHTRESKPCHDISKIQFIMVHSWERNKNCNAMSTVIKFIHDATDLIFLFGIEESTPKKYKLFEGYELYFRIT